MLLSGVDQVITLHGKTFFAITGTTGVPFVYLSPLVPTSLQSGISLFPGARLNYLAQAFEEFRFTRLVFKLHPVPAAFTSGYVIGYNKTTAASSTPTTNEGIYEADSSRYISAAETTSQMMVIPPRVLRGGLRVWYKTQYNSSNDSLDDCFQGVIFTSNAGSSGGFTLEVGYTLQLRGNDDPSGT
jgi:hypothetical protein